MNAGLALQYVLIAAAVLASALFVWRTRFPGAWRRARVVAAAWLLRDGRSPALQRLGRRLAPVSPTASAGSCGSCDGCG